VSVLIIWEGEKSDRRTKTPETKYLTIEAPGHQLLNNQEHKDRSNVVLDRHCS
jgi:hypothetical protein